MSTSPTATQLFHSQQTPKKSRRTLRFMVKFVLLPCVTIVPLSLFALMAIALVFPKISGKQAFARVDAAKSDEATLASELHEFKLDCGRYPTTEEGLRALYKPPADLTRRWKGPYAVKRVLLDPWGHRYSYRSNGNSFKITSYGADGLPGGNGDYTDIVDNE